MDDTARGGTGRVSKDNTQPKYRIVNKSDGIRWHETTPEIGEAKVERPDWLECNSLAESLADSR